MWGEGNETSPNIHYKLLVIVYNIVSSTLDIIKIEDLSIYRFSHSDSFYFQAVACTTKKAVMPKQFR